MNGPTYHCANGYATGHFNSYKRLVKKKIGRALASNHWSSTEYNSNNAWNVNFSSANVNNNNKNNQNVVRAVAALTQDEKEAWLDAFDDCCRAKKSAVQCTFYRLHYEEDLWLLAAEVKLRMYTPRYSYVFCVTRPKVREVFAANFRDRIVQHWIIQRLNPLFEERFTLQGNVSFNCRKGFGTLAASKRLQQDLYRVTEGFTKSAWIGKFDIVAFFMTVDAVLLTKMMLRLIDEQYTGSDIADLIYLTQVVMLHRPQFSCKKRGNLELWDVLAPNKSMFNTTGYRGMPIGNLTAQIPANYYMSFFDEVALKYIKSFGGAYGRFVDDFYVILPEKHQVVEFFKMSTVWLKEYLHLDLHQDKVYIQEARKGIAFVGTVHRPFRVYISNRTLGNLTNKMMAADHYKYRENLSFNDYNYLNHIVCGLNSYLGLCKYTNSYAQKCKHMYKSNAFWKYAYIKGNFKSVNLKNRYSLKHQLYGAEAATLRKRRPSSLSNRNSGRHSCFNSKFQRGRAFRGRPRVQ